jgi:hypothetical protein
LIIIRLSEPHIAAKFVARDNALKFPKFKAILVILANAAHYTPTHSIPFFYKSGFKNFIFKNCMREAILQLMGGCNDI